MAGISSGRILRLEEIARLGKDLDGKSVRTWGRVVCHDICTSQVQVTNGDDSQHQICIGSASVEPMAFKKGSLYRFIGEMRAVDGNAMILEARIATCIDGIDRELFQKALDMRRAYLKDQAVEARRLETFKKNVMALPFEYQAV